ncbi:zinc-ribbon domain-containing protein [Methanosphaera cuniculi]|uniref:zinc-ribbon domain-containing protein n=1 Tax=Methanosphaera cuniculi TaxID=1077256 RepID=UPI0026DA862E|nr:zinc-ribbon domain-containing protein [Methanosphaera cuniculi]
MKCDRCNYENPDDAKICINCGYQLPENPTIICHIQNSNTKNNTTPNEQQNLEKTVQINKQRNDNDYYETQYKGPGSNYTQTNPVTRKAQNQNKTSSRRNDNDYYETQYRGPSTFNKIEPKKGKKLWLTILLSILCVGLGQIYLKEYKKAFIFITIAIITSILSMRYEIFLVIGLFNGIYQLLDVIKDYKKYYINE